jgi:hypothetical protein
VPRRTSLAVEFYLVELVRGHPDWGAPRLREAVDARYPPDADGRGAISQSKIGSLLPKLRDQSGTWRLEPGEPEPAFVLSVMMQQEHDGLRLGRRQVEWIRTVHAAAPTLEPAGVLLVANIYATTEVLGLDEFRHTLDVALASGLSPEGIYRLAGENLDLVFGGGEGAHRPVS